jgi:hypothetical protein
VTEFEVFHDGNENFFDVYEFTAFDPDEPKGRTSTFESLENALKYAYDELRVDRPGSSIGA